MNEAFYLSSLQKIDRRIDQINSRLSEISKTLETDTTVEICKKNLESAELDLKRTKQKLLDIEFRNQQIQIKINQSESSLYSGKIKNPKELQDLEKEISSLKNNLSALEDVQIEMMLDYENAEKLTNIARDSLIQAQNQFNSKQSLLLGEREALLRELEKLNIERKAAISQVAEETLAQYDKLRKTKGGIAIATVEDGACSICGASMTPADVQLSRSPHMIIFCTSCGRIVYGG